jgi:predicted permease
MTLARTPSRLAIWALRTLMSRDQANAVLGDLSEDLARLSVDQGEPRWPHLWLEWRTWHYLAAAVPSAFARFADRLEHDVRYSWRRLRRSPGFTLIAVLTLALGIGANTALFGLVNSLLLKSLPVPALDRMIAIGATRPQSSAISGLTDDDIRPLEDLVARHDTLESVAARDLVHGAIVASGRSHVSVVEAVSGGYFHTVGVTPLLGRLLDPSDDRPNADGAIVLSEGTWRALFDASPAVVGRTVRMTGHVLTVVGVVPDSYHGLFLPMLLRMDAWVPLRDADALDGEMVVKQLGAPSVTTRPHGVSARLLPGVTIEQAAARLSALGAHMTFAFGRTGLVVLPARNAIVPEEFDHYGRLLGVAVVALSGLVLLIACSNLTNLLLARTASRSIEIAVRMAGGASRARVGQLLLVETALVAALAGVVGLSIAWLTSWALTRIALPELDGQSIRFDPSLDLHVFTYGFVVAAIATFAIGLVPAWRASRTDPMRVFANAGGAGGGSGRGGRLRGALIAVQMAASTVLLLAAGLFVRSVLAGMAYQPGFSLAHTAIGEINLEYHGYDEARGRVYFRRLADAASHTPGLAQAALASDVPANLLTSAPDRDLLAEGEAPVQTPYGPGGHACDTVIVTHGFFSTIGVSFRRGRDFTPADVDGTTPVVIINESVAALLWPGQDPVGRRLTLSKDGKLLTVVGLVADTDRSSPYPQAWRYAFVPLDQHYSPRMSIVGRGFGDARAVPDLLRAVVRGLDPEVALYDVAPLAQHVALWLIPLRYTAAILMTLGILGGAIAMIGIYGVTAYLGGLRTREFGIRKALGATRADIYGLVLRQATRTLTLGVVPGLVAAYLASNLLEHLLYGVRPHDVMTFVAVPVGLVVVALIASYVPARRAAAIDPNVALRNL